MKYTIDELNDFIKEIKNLCISKTTCGECPLQSDSVCAFYKCPDEWTKLKPKKKVVPFDFSLKEDRDALIGKRIRTDACDMVVTTFAYWLAHGWQIQIDSENGFSGEYVLENFVFADGPNEGKPVGKEMEE